MNLLSYKREEIQQFVKDGICPIETLNHYDVIKALNSGGKPQDVAFDNNLSRQHVYKIKNKYMNGK